MTDELIDLALDLKMLDDHRLAAVGNRLWDLASSSRSEIAMLGGIYEAKICLKAWSESAHPRAASGSSSGGQFVSAGTSSTTTTRAATEGARNRLGGELTSANIKRFQRAHGLLVDGKIGRQTAAALLGEDTSKIKPGPMTHEQRLQLEKMAPAALHDRLSRTPKQKPKPDKAPTKKPKPTGGVSARGNRNT